MTPTPPSVPPQKQEQSGCSRGCLIAVLVVGGVLVLVGLVAAVGAWKFAQSDEGKKIFSAVGKGVQLAQKGMSAPGAAEVRAAGCPEAIVLDMKDMAELVDLFVDGGIKGDDPGLPRIMVMCQGSFGLPSCDEVATVYAGVKDRPGGEFTVLVQRKGGQKQCSKRYADDGTSLGEWTESNSKTK